MAKNNLSIVILAAGKGTRMKSKIPKVMHKIAGLSMLEHVINTASRFSPKEIILVLSPENKEYVENYLPKKENIKIVVQAEQKGTANALSSAMNEVNGENILVLYGDVPFITIETLEKLSDLEAEISLLGFYTDNPGSYGRLIIDRNQLIRIKEVKDADEYELSIKYCNAGILKLSTNTAKKLLPKIQNNNSSSEYYLTDIISLAVENNVRVDFLLTNEDELIGVNSKVDLAKAELFIQNKLRNYFMLEKGVTLIDPNSVYFSYDTKIEEDVVVEPNVFIGNKVTIKSNSYIKANSYIENVFIGNNAQIGPFARIRGFTEIKDNAQIGNFVEIKNSVVGKSSKANHLAYIGDSEIGERTNIGAGAITCNYDGVNKHKTVIGDRAFIGSNVCLIAPINIENNSMVAAGSVINKEVKKGELAVARSKQLNIKDGTKKIRKKNEKNS